MRPVVALFIAAAALFAPSPADAANAVMERTKGKILLDVERGGEAWYVSPVSGFRYRLGTPKEAFEAMRTFGVGVSSADLSRIIRVGEAGATAPAIRPYVSGRILLDVARGGAAWYVDPDTARRHPLGSPTEAFRVMAALGLGIRSIDLAQIPIGVRRGAAAGHVASFVPQAPFGEWWDRRQDEGCEEASALMAVNWARGGGPIDYGDARDAIIGAAEYEDATYGSYEDTSVADTAQRIFREYFGFDDIEVRTGIGANDIAAALRSGSIVVVGVNARKLENPWYSQPAPIQHMVVVVGYDPLADEFVVHDPGTRNGNSMRFDATVLERALLDYPTGYRETLVPRPASMIIVHKAE